MSPTLRPAAGALLVVVLLLAGALVGVLLDHVMMEHRFHHFGGPPSRSHMLDRLQRELELTPAQRAEVDSIFRVHEQGVLAMRTQVRALFDSSRASLHAALKGVLTPAQLEKFRRLELRAGPGWGGFGRHGHGHGHGRDGGDHPPYGDRNDSGPDGGHP